MLKRRRFDSDDDDENISDVNESVFPFRSSSKYTEKAAFSEEYDPEMVGLADATEMIGNGAFESVLMDVESANVSNSGQTVPIEQNDGQNSFVQLDDLDISSTYFSVLSSATLLSAYLPPFQYMKEKKNCDSLLLAQYVPSRNLVSETHTTLPASMAIEPGWRWDGVQRGRRKQ